LAITRKFGHDLIKPLSNKIGRSQIFFMIIVVVVFCVLDARQVRSVKRLAPPTGE